MPGLPLLILTTSHGVIGDTLHPTGLNFETVAAPYWAFRDAGLEVVIASVAGGEPPVDPVTLDDPPASVGRFQDDPAALGALNDTPGIDGLDSQAYAGILLAGGHGALWDFAGNGALGTLVGAMAASGRIVAAISHGAAGLLQARTAEGHHLVAGRRLTAFSDAEEQSLGLIEAVPFLLETLLRQQAAQIESGANFRSHVVRDGMLITGQNPESSAATAAEIIAALRS